MMNPTLAFLSGTGSHVSSCVRTWLALLFIMRLFAVIITAKTVWEDDMQDLSCNSTQVGCRQQCYTELSPLSPFTLFTLQIVFLSTLSMTNFLYNRHSLRQARDNFIQAANETRWKIGFLNMLAKILTEGIFLFLQHMLYPGLLRQHRFRCDITPCEEAVVCIMLKSQQKDAFVIFMYTCSFASVLIEVIEIYSSVGKVRLSQGAYEI
ncbi:gap junction beta-1 protein-like [Scyliorhinus canicula]|uniref:gap junction beta-1 protein-like n=1 Tax=Scyliorhinus canicula TaxID=7830 RepID=UPI0018F77805|nr:gap junction beta-1 protein-like [Scyliorhinus canicula]